MLRINRDNGIVWCDATANAWKGCAKISEGCRHCWAETIMTRFGHTEEFTIANAQEGIDVYVTEPAEAIEPLDRLDAQWVFLPSSSDPFLPWVPEDARRGLLAGLRENDHHVYQVLTKWGAEKANEDHPDELRSSIPTVSSWPENVILGVSCESPRRRYRLDWLREQDAAMKFVSFEPLVEKIETVDLSGIDWIVVGGESHPDAEARREMGRDWPLPLLEAAREEDVAFLFKQHSGARAEADRELLADNALRVFNEFPATAEGLPDAPREFLVEEPEVAA